MKMKNHKTGFTLIDLLTASTITVVLLTLTTPLVVALGEKSRLEACAANQQLIGQAVGQYGMVFGESLPPMTARTQNQTASRWAGYFMSSTLGGDCNLAFAWRAGLLPADGKALFCPGQVDEVFTHAAYAKPCFPPTAASETGFVRVTSGYYYNPTATSLTDRNRIYRKAWSLSDEVVLTVDLLDKTTLPAHPGGGLNVLRGDGAVGFVVDPLVVADMQDSNFTGNNYFQFDTALDRLADTGKSKLAASTLTETTRRF